VRDVLSWMGTLALEQAEEALDARHKIARNRRTAVESV